MSFGVELSVDNAIGVFFHDHFGLSQTHAGMIGALFGLMNLFSRATGGSCPILLTRKWVLGDDYYNYLLEWYILDRFPIFFKYLAQAVTILVFFSYFTQACCGSVFAIVPFADPGAVSGPVED